MDDARAKRPESIIINSTHSKSKLFISCRNDFWAQLTISLVEKAVAVLCSANAGDLVRLILIKLKLIVQSYLFAYRIPLGLFVLACIKTGERAYQSQCPLRRKRKSYGFHQRL